MILGKGLSFENGSQKKNFYADLGCLIFYQNHLLAAGELNSSYSFCYFSDPVIIGLQDLFYRFFQIKGLNWKRIIHFFHEKNSAIPLTDLACASYFACTDHPNTQGALWLLDWRPLHAC